jgi:hypothetical protein
MQKHACRGCNKDELGHKARNGKGQVHLRKTDTHKGKGYRPSNDHQDLAPFPV